MEERNELQNELAEEQALTANDCEAEGGVVIDLGGEDDADGLWLEAHADTLGGMVFSTFESIPEEGSKPEVTINGLHVQVESILDHRVEKALVSKVIPEPEEENAEDEADEQAEENE